MLAGGMGEFFNILQLSPHILPISQSEGMAPLTFLVISSLNIKAQIRFFQ